MVLLSSSLGRSGPAIIEPIIRDIVTSEKGERLVILRSPSDPGP